MRPPIPAPEIRTLGFLALASCSGVKDALGLAVGRYTSGVMCSESEGALAIA